MDYITAVEANRGGFDFDNHARNHLMEGHGIKLRGALKSGTTICGVCCKDAVVLAADTRATAGSVVADGNCSKLHPIASNICCAGAGTAADLDHQTDLMASEMKMLALQMGGRQTRVSSVVRKLSSKLFNHQGYIGCALIMAGVDINGPSLFQIYPHGSTDRLPFACMGSGSLAAMAVMESRFKDDLTIEEGKALVADAIRAGIFNDLGSGGNVDVCVVTRDTYNHTRAYDAPNPRIYRALKPIQFPPGTTTVLKEDIRKLITVTSEDVVMTQA